MKSVCIKHLTWNCNECLPTPTPTPKKVVTAGASQVPNTSQQQKVLILPTRKIKLPKFSGPVVYPPPPALLPTVPTPSARITPTHLSKPVIGASTSLPNPTNAPIAPGGTVFGSKYTGPFTSTFVYPQIPTTTQSTPISQSGPIITGTIGSYQPVASTSTPSTSLTYPTGTGSTFASSLALAKQQLLQYAPPRVTNVPRAPRPTASGPVLSSLIYPLYPSATTNSVPTVGQTYSVGTSGTKRRTLAADKRIAAAKKKKTIIDDEIAIEVFRDLNLSTNFLNSGKVLAWALQPDDEAFINIHDYVARSQEHGFGVKILTILRVIVQADSLTSTAPLDFKDDPNAEGMYRMMLWHGTKTSALTSILENGLKLPTMHGQMFGAGIYFADRVSKSCQYCDRATYTRYLFLCDVLLGNMYKSNQALPTTTTTYAWGGDNVQYNSVKGCGQNVPDIEWQKEIDGCVWPLGPTVPNQEDAGPLTLKYNEYIVYDTNQVQPKYLVKVEFTRTPVYENLY